MSARIEIPMALETSGIAKGAKDGEKALKQLEKAVEEAGKGSRDLNNVERSLDDVEQGARDSERAVKRLEGATEDTGRHGSRAIDGIEDELRDVQTASDQTADSMFKIAGEAEKTGVTINRAMGTDIRQGINAVGDLLDGRVAGAMNNILNATTSISQSLPIIGIGIAAAAGIAGPLLSGMQEQQDELNASVQRMKQHYADAWKAAVEGGRDYIDQATIIGEMNDIIFNPDRADEYKRIQEDANRLVVDRSVLLRAAAGDQDALNEVQSRANALWKQQEDALQAVINKGTDRHDTERLNILDEMDLLQGVTDRWREYGDVNDENRQKAIDAANTTSDYLLDTIAKAGKATRAVDDFGNQLITLPDGVQIVIDAKTGKATTDLNTFKKDTDEVVKDLDGSEINLVVKTALQQAQNDLNRFMSRNNGRTIRLHGRFNVTGSGMDLD